MAINAIENITVDNVNKIFGGFIYSVDYQAFSGETPSTVKVSIINEAGEYFITPADLRLRNNPTEIKIGSKITLNMYPIEYRSEISEVGRFLEIHYVDESIYFLDGQYVGLKDRQEPTDSVILLGDKKVVIDYLGVSINFDENAGSIKAPEVVYTFPQLVEAIDNIIELPQGFEFDEDYNSFYRNYTGTLRQVLSAWCNDLGFMFYWEDHKVHLLDLRNEDLSEIVQIHVDTILNQISPSSVEESFSLRDTFVRGLNSTFVKDGSVIPNDNDPGEDDYTFAKIAIEDFPGMEDLAPNGIVAEALKGAHYGTGYLIAVLAKTALYNTQYFQNPSNPSVNVASYRQYNPTNAVDLLKINYINSSFDLPKDASKYSWVKFEILNDIAPFLERYKQLSAFLNRFFYIEMSKDSDLIFDSEVPWFHKYDLVKNTPMNRYLAFFSERISNYNTLTLNNVFGGTSVDETDEGRTKLGYYIKEIEPVWNPSSHDRNVLLRDGAIIVEPDDDETINETNVFIVGLDKDLDELSNISLPYNSTVSLYAEKRKTSVLSTAQSHIDWHKTTYPSNFSTANVSYVDMQQNNIAENLITIQSESLDNQQLNQANFEEADSLFQQSVVFNQSKPFFSKTFSVPYIDLPVQPRISEGLQSVNIRVGEQGVTATYTFGNENMKVRSSDFYIENFYDSRKKEVLSLLSPKITISRGSSNII